MDLIHVLGGGLEPPRLAAYAPQTYVSAISPPERFEGTQLVSRTTCPASVSSRADRSSGVAGVQEANAIAGNNLLTPVLKLRWRNHGDLNPFSRPGVFQNFRPILQWEFIADNFVDLNLAAFEISQGARKSVNLREVAFNRYFAAKKIERVESDGVSFRVNAV